MHTRRLLISTLVVAGIFAGCSDTKNSDDAGPGPGGKGGSSGAGAADGSAASGGSAGSGGAGATGGASGGETGGVGGTGTMGSAGTGATDAGEDGGGTTGTGGTGGPDGAAGTAGTGGTAGADAGATSCSTGSLIVGDPLYNDKPSAGAPKPAGQPVLADPPIRNEAIAVIGTKLFVETEFEIWSTDLSAASPVISRFAGVEGEDYINAGVACRDTRFLVVRDMTATADGKLVLCDYVGGAIVEITDPGGPNCRSNWVAGTSTRTDDPGNNYPLAKGDRDGPGAQALFGGTMPGGAGIHKVTVDPAGNIYTWDEGTGKHKKIATDSARTVSTIGRSSTNDNVMALQWLNGKLYAIGVDGTNDFMLEVDPATYNAANPTANVKQVFRTRNHFPEVPSSNQAVISGMTTDGQALIISAQSGYVWRVATDGTVLQTLAGTGRRLDYENGFDPLIPHPANQWQLLYNVSNSNGGPWLWYQAGKLYWAGGYGIGKHILRFSCP
jgi:hypothetical protein